MLHDFEWNWGQFPPTHPVCRALASLVAFNPNRSPNLIGTAFLIGAYEEHAVIMTAAHNLYEGVSKIQNPDSSHHTSALSEFLPRFEEVAIDRGSLRVIYDTGDKPEMCVVRFAAWDKARDVAILTIAPQDGKDKNLFKHMFRIESANSAVGDAVAIVGFADMATISVDKNKEMEIYTLQQRPILRAGRIKALHRDGHILCRGPCIETSVPVMPGMSGAPVFLMPEYANELHNMVPVALVSHDPDDDKVDKFDRSQCGSSIASILPIEVAEQNAKVSRFFVRLENAHVVANNDATSSEE